MQIFSKRKRKNVYKISKTQTNIAKCFAKIQRKDVAMAYSREHRGRERRMRTQSHILQTQRDELNIIASEVRTQIGELIF